MTRRFAAAALLSASGAAPAHACTLCHSRVAEDVRALLFGSDFWWNAAMLLLPAPPLIAAVLLLRRLTP